MSFHDQRLPLSLAFGVSGGPERLTDVVRLASGSESRNARWQGSRRRWEAASAPVKLDVAHELLAFFEARRGRMHGFRFRDPVDCKSCAPSATPAATDQPLGTGNGATTTFQLTKRYGSGDEAWTRAITRPVSDSVLVAISGVATNAFTIDLTTGLVTFTSPPAIGAALTAGFQFDVPVRFDADRLEITLDGFDAARVRAPLVEIED